MDLHPCSSLVGYLRSSCRSYIESSSSNNCIQTSPAMSQKERIGNHIACFFMGSSLHLIPPSSDSYSRHSIQIHQLPPEAASCGALGSHMYAQRLGSGDHGVAMVCSAKTRHRITPWCLQSGFCPLEMWRITKLPWQRSILLQRLKPLQMFWLQVSQFSSFRENSSALQTRISGLGWLFSISTDFLSKWGGYLSSEAGPRVHSDFLHCGLDFKLSPWVHGGPMDSDSPTATTKTSWTLRWHFQMYPRFYFKRDWGAQFPLSKEVLRNIDIFWKKKDQLKSYVSNVFWIWTWTLKCLRHFRKNITTAAFKALKTVKA